MRKNKAPEVELGDEPYDSSSLRDGSFKFEEFEEFWFNVMIIVTVIFLFIFYFYWSVVK